MENNNRSQIVLGSLLILLGLWFLAVRLVPGLEELFAWPFIIIAAGVGLFLLGLVVNAPGMAVPASIVTGIGGLLAWQNATGHWESWAYAWALIPGFVGVGIIMTGVLEGDVRSKLQPGGWLIVISAVMFAIFGSFLGGVALFGPFWPALLILLGLIMLGQSLLGRRVS